MFNGEPKPLYASADPRSYPIARVYFFEKSDGTRIFTEEKEAWSLCTRAPQILGIRTYPFKFLGSSDGRLYSQAIAECKQIMNETGNLQEAQARLKRGEEEEFAVAKGNMVYPRNMDKMGPAANELMI